MQENPTMVVRTKIVLSMIRASMISGVAMKGASFVRRNRNFYILFKLNHGNTNVLLKINTIQMN